MNSKLATTALIATLVTVGFMTPAAAQPSQAQVQSQTNVEAETQADTSGVFGQIMSKLTSIQERLDRISQRLNKIEARGNAQVDIDASGSEKDRNDSGEASSSSGAEVNHSVEVENGTKTIKHRVEKDGNVLVNFVKEIFVGSDTEAETEVEGEIDIQLEGNVSKGENVTVTASHNGSVVANATVKVNGEVVGQTDSEGEIVVQVESSEEFEVEVEKEELEGELEIELEAESEEEKEESENKSEIETEAGLESETETEASGNGFKTRGEADLSASADLER